MSCATVFVTIFDWMFRKLFYDRGCSSDRYLRNARNSFAEGYIYMDPYTYSYGPSRSTIYPWSRDEEWRRKPAVIEKTGGTEKPGGNEKPEVKVEASPSLKSAMPPTPQPTTDVTHFFHVVNVELNIQENTLAHHTNKYMCTQKKFNPKLVVRRGQSFVMTIHFNREYDVAQNDIQFSFKTGQNPMPPRRTAERIAMNENPASRAVSGQWFAKLFNVKEKSINVEITPASNCIIGEWMFTIHTEAKSKDSVDPIKLEYNYNEDIIILLNPWCIDDQVYMATEGLLDEYILNESGALYGGNYQQIGAKPWNYGQFEDGILEICLHVVRKAFNNTVDPGMADCVKLARAVSQIINAQDDGGVLIGNWSGNYDDGTSPTTWVGSVSILKQYEANKGEPVKYGQCWVFSGVTTTVCRAIGFPARSITNFNSAHDTDGSTSIDHPYVCENGVWRKLRNSDSVWNFHVWNEVWMSRIGDLGKGFDGWQVIDATPQEVSEGQYRCGPCPVNAIKKGEIGRVKYDAPFIFAEVNADVVDWEIKANNYWVVLNTNTNHVGKNVSTKKPDGQPYRGELTMLNGYAENFREDITHEYKYDEGTLDERLAVHSANLSAGIERDPLALKPKDIVVEIISKDGILVGNDFEVEIKLKNTAQDRDTRTVTKIVIKVDSVKYTGEMVAHITEKFFQNITLAYQEEKLLKLPIKTQDYLDKMFELFGMHISALAHVKETENVHLKYEEYRLRRPDITITGPAGVAHVGENYELKLSFTNSLPVPLTKCSLLIEGSGIKSLSRTERDVPAKSEWSSLATVQPYNNGKIQVNVSFACRELKDITGFIVFSV